MIPGFVYEKKILCFIEPIRSPPEARNLKKIPGEGGYILLIVMRKNVYVPYTAFGSKNFNCATQSTKPSLVRNVSLSSTSRLLDFVEAARACRRDVISASRSGRHRFPPPTRDDGMKLCSPVRNRFDGSSPLPDVITNARKRCERCCDPGVSSRYKFRFGGRFPSTSHPAKQYNNRRRWQYVGNQLVVVTAPGRSGEINFRTAEPHRGACSKSNTIGAPHCTSCKVVNRTVCIVTRSNLVSPRKPETLRPRERDLEPPPRYPPIGRRSRGGRRRSARRFSFAKTLLFFSIEIVQTAGGSFFNCRSTAIKFKNRFAVARRK